MPRMVCDKVKVWGPRLKNNWTEVAKTMSVCTCLWCGSKWQISVRTTFLQARASSVMCARKVTSDHRITRQCLSSNCLRLSDYCYSL